MIKCEACQQERDPDDLEVHKVRIDYITFKLKYCKRSLDCRDKVVEMGRHRINQLEDIYNESNA